MTLRELYALLPKEALDLPLCVDSGLGYVFEVSKENVLVEDDEYVALDPPPPAPMSEATRKGRHILLTLKSG